MHRVHIHRMYVQDENAVPWDTLSQWANLRDGEDELWLEWKDPPTDVLRPLEQESLFMDLLIENGSPMGLRIHPKDKAAQQQRKEKEQAELLLILQDALIAVSEVNSELASRLAARAYVNLKTNPQGQRRFDGLLHRFTGVLHRHSVTRSNTLKTPPLHEGG
ncbi:MAG: hypothetical protein M1318_06545 [Firmicutes bacterium]|nr:hypothetical protein [Bacillota bacterium]